MLGAHPVVEGRELLSVMQEASQSGHDRDTTGVISVRERALTKEKALSIAVDTGVVVIAVAVAVVLVVLVVAAAMRGREKRRGLR